MMGISDSVTRHQTPTIFNTTMTDADTEYSQVLTVGTNKFQIRTRDGTAFRLAFVTGKVATPTAPYLTIPADHSFEEIVDSRQAITLFFASASAGKVAEISIWKGA